MRSLTKLKKVTICKIVALSGIIMFTGLMFAFVVNACTAMNVTLAWWFFALMIMAFIMFLAASIIYIKLDYARIKAYIKKIIN